MGGGVSAASGERMTKPEWLELYESAVVETDNAVLERRIAEAEKAISSRLAEIGSGSENTAQEQRTIHAAAKALEILRRERLQSGNARK
jgi:hypothetical protein